jgi:hypothetical protein
MRHLMRIVVIGISSVTAFAQSVPPKVSIELGSVTVSLGMPRQEVVKRCASLGFKAIDAPNGITFLSGDDMYKVEFRNDRLIYASREWFFAKGELDAFQSTMAALGVGADSDPSITCTISHQPLTTPEMQINRVFIVCGNRSYLLIDGQMNGDKIHGVTESIGKGK